MSRTAHASFVLDALEQALHDRRPAHRGGLVHHSDRSSQYVSIKYTERLAEAGIEPSVGSVGDSYDNALAETINGLYKAEVIHRRGPWRSFDAVEYATLEWVDWFNNRRLLEPIGNIPPAEAERQYYAMLDKRPHGSITQTKCPPEISGRFSVIQVFFCYFYLLAVNFIILIILRVDLGAVDCVGDGYPCALRNQAHQCGDKVGTVLLLR